MKSHHCMSLLLLAALLAACGGKPTASSEANEHPPEAGHDKEQGEHAEGEGEEGPAQTTIAEQVAANAGIRIGRAGPGVIADEHEVQGLLTPVDGGVARVMARFPGPIRSLRANVGDRVGAGQPLATIESNLSLTTYTVSAPISGIVLSRDASIGAVASEGMALYEIVNTSELWVDLHIFGRDAQHIQPGNAVAVTHMGDGTTVHTELERILPSTATASQSTVARARIRNADGLWRPGTAVKARVTVDQADVALAVPLSAIQSDGEDEVVYVKQGADTYVTRVVRLGRRDTERVEVLEGLKAGEQIVVTQSFLIKADIEKSTAEHEH